jgi:hypothetical protein
MKKHPTLWEELGLDNRVNRYAFYAFMALYFATLSMAFAAPIIMYLQSSN